MKLVDVVRVAADSNLVATNSARPLSRGVITTAGPKWQPGDTIPLGRRTLRVIDVRGCDTDEPTVLVVEDTSV